MAPFFGASLTPQKAGLAGCLRADESTSFSKLAYAHNFFSLWCDGIRFARSIRNWLDTDTKNDWHLRRNAYGRGQRA